MIVGLTTLETVWLRTAQELDLALEGMFPRFFRDVVIPEVKNPWSVGRREQNVEEDVKEYIQKNGMLLEIFSSKMLDYLADYYRSSLLSLNEHELVLLILISGMARIPLMPQTRELLNERLVLDEQFTFCKGLQTLFDVQYRSEFTSYLAKKQGLRLCEIQELRDAQKEEVKRDTIQSVSSVEECYENYCNIIHKLLRNDIQSEDFLREYEWYQVVREKIASGEYPKYGAKIAKCIRINYAQYFVTDNRHCMHFRLSAMLARGNEDETVTICFKDVLSYPGMEELEIERRRILWNPREDLLEEYHKLKCRVIRSIWLADWNVFLKSIRKAERAEYATIQKTVYWKDKETMILDYIGAIPLQMRYDRFIEGEVRLIILRSMHRLSEATKRLRGRRFCEKFSRYAFALAQKECPGCLEEKEDSIDVNLWKQGNIYEKLSISTGDLRMHRYFLYQGLEEKYLSNIFDDPERKKLKEEFEQQMEKDIAKIVRYWFLRNINLTKKLLAEY